MSRWWLYFALFLPALAEGPILGRVDFATSGSPRAQQHFIQGLLWLHSFEYDDARNEFKQASRIEPRFAMAYWGEAMTYNHPLWMQVDPDAARAALTRLAPTPEARLAAAPTEREKDYLRAVETLYGDGDKVSRDAAYAEAMHRLMQRYPSDLDAAAFYALALMGSCERDRQYPVYMRAAAVAEEVFAANPQHPGAIHYLIHAYDDPVHAPLGLRPARVYAKIAGAASHAQHMPSHIFIALGMWDEVIASNEASVAVADERMKRKHGGPEDRNAHALLWLEYGYLQRSRRDDAHRLLADEAHSIAGSQNSHLTGSLNEMRAVWAVETGEWDDLVQELDPAKGPLAPRIAALTAKGMAAAKAGRIDEAQALLEKARSAHAEPPMTGVAGHSAMPRRNENDPARGIMLDELQAVLLYATHRTDDALKLLAKAAVEEDAMSFEFGPPFPVKPAHELYGELLLDAGKPAEARQQFKLALARCPERALSTHGLARAAELEKNTQVESNISRAR